MTCITISHIYTMFYFYSLFLFLVLLCIIQSTLLIIRHYRDKKSEFHEKIASEFFNQAHDVAVEEGKDLEFYETWMRGASHAILANDYKDMKYWIINNQHAIEKYTQAIKNIKQKK